MARTSVSTLIGVTVVVGLLAPPRVTAQSGTIRPTIPALGLDSSAMVRVHERQVPLAGLAARLAGTLHRPEPRLIVVRPFPHIEARRIISPEIDSPVRLSGAGRQLLVRGPITCLAGDEVRIRVTVTQRTTGAVAEGRWRRLCTGGSRHWTTKAAVAEGPAAFAAGPAQACAVALARRGGKPTDALQWCHKGDVLLVATGE
jgi:hypothetical protein